MKRTLVILAVVLMASLSALKFSRGTTRRAPLQPKTQVSWVRVEEEREAPRLTLTGYARPYRRAALQAEVQAAVLERRKDLGQSFGAGEVLIRLDSRQAEQQSQQALALWQAAEAEGQRLLAERARAAREVEGQLEVSQALVQASQAQLRQSLNSTRPEELAQAQANLRAAEADCQQKQRDYLRFEALRREGAVAEQACEQKRLEWTQSQQQEARARETLKLAQEGARLEERQRAQASLDQSRGQLQQAEAGPFRVRALDAQIGSQTSHREQRRAAYQESHLVLQKHTLLAPFAGVVLSHQVEVGDMAAPGKSLMEVGEIDRLRVRFDLPEVARYQVQAGQKVELSCPALGAQVLPARLTYLGHEAEPQSRTFPVEVMLENPGRRVLPNSLLELRLAVGPARRRFRLPRHAVVTQGAASFVYRPQAGRLQPQRIEITDLQGEWVYLEGLGEARSPVAAHAALLRPGLEVGGP